MTEIMEFIKDNQILSGSIGAIIAALIGYFSVLKSKSSQKQRIGNNSKGYQAGGDIKINEK